MSIEDTILETKDIPEPVAVPTPEWPAVDGQIFVIRLTTMELADMWSWYGEEANDNEPLAPYAVVACARQADGMTQVFTRARVHDLAQKAGSAISRIFRAADELNFLTAASRETIRKN